MLSFIAWQSVTITLKYLLLKYDKIEILINGYLRRYGGNVCRAKQGGTKFLGLKIIWKKRKDSHFRRTKLLPQNSLTLVKWPKFPNIFQNSLTWRKFDFSLTRGNPGHNVYLQLFLGTSKLDIFTGTTITQTSILKIKYFWYT